jgi:hypothetical protein
MGNMLDKFRGQKAPDSKNTVSVYSVGPIAKPMGQQRAPLQDSRLPRAVAIYGAAAAVFAVLTIFYFIQGMWFTGLILIVPTFCLGGFSWYYLKASGNRLR